MLNYRWIVFLTLLFHSIFSHAQNQLSQNKPERLFAKGKELVDHKQFGAAREVFTSFLEASKSTDPRRGEAKYYIAFSSLNLGHADGEKLIDQFVSEYPSSPKAATAFYDLAIFFYEDNNYKQAISYFSKVDFPALTTAQQDKGHFCWGYAHFSSRELDQALAQFNFVKERNNAYSPAASYYAGFVEYNQGKNEAALTDLLRAEKSSSYANVVPYIIANVYYNLGRYDELIAYTTKVKSRPNVYNMEEIAMLEGEAYYRKQDYQKALPAYERYLEGDAKASSSVLYRAGHASYLLKQDDKAIRYLKQAAASTDSVSFHASYYLGILYLKNGEKRFALNSFDHARKNGFDANLTREGTFQFAKVSYDMGNPDVAIAELEQYLKTYPGSSHDQEVRELLAQAYVNGNNFNKAIEYIESLPRRNLTMDKAYQKATYLKGTEYFNKAEYTSAIEVFQKSLAYPLDPKITAKASFWCGEAFSIMSKFEEASKHYLTVVGLGKEVEADVMKGARYGLGYAYYSMQTYDRALFNYREFINLSKPGERNYYDGLIRLADCYYVSKSYDQALSTYTQASQAGKADNDYILLQTGTINGILSRYSQSRTILSSLIKNYPNSPYVDDALLKRGELEIEEGNYQAAIDVLSQLINQHAKSPFIPRAYERRAAAHSNVGSPQKAADDYVYLIQHYPGSEVSQKSILSMQSALIAAGRTDEFQKHMEVIRRTNPDNKELEAVEYESAKNIYFSSQYDKSAVAMSSYISRYPLSPHINEAKYYLADSYYRQSDFAKALPLFQEISNDVALTQHSRIVYRLAEIYFSQKEYLKAAQEYTRLSRVANGKKEQFNAWSGLMESYYLLGTYDSVPKYANLILEKGNVNVGAENKASLYLGKAAYAKGDNQTAQDEFLNTLNTARDEYGAEAKYLLAEIFYLEKNHKQCYETLVSLTKDFAAYDEWVGKAFLLLADNFIATGEVFQAKATLESLVPGFPLPWVQEAAKKKLKEIEQKQLSEKKEADSLEVQN